MSIEEAVNMLAPKKRTRVARKVMPDAPVIPVHEEPRKELRRLVGMHARWTREARTFGQMVGPIPIFPSDGKPVIEKGKLPKRPTDKDPVTVVAIKAAQKQLQHAAGELEKAMVAELKKLPVFNLFLDRVYGIGPVVAAYIAANVDISRAWQPSKLARYFGNTPGPSGRMERRVAGSAPKYAPNGELDSARGGSPNDTMRTILWQGMVAMRKNSAKFTRCAAHDAAWGELKPADRAAFRREKCAECPECAKTASPFGQTSKYLDRWAESLHASRTMPYVNPDGKPTNIDKKGRMKAADVFIHDLYMIMRAIDGLDVFPTYATVKRDREHGMNGPVNNGQGAKMSVDEALAMIGEVGKRPATRFMFDADVEEEDGDDE